MPECGVAIQILGKKISCSFKFISDKTEAEKPSAHSVFGVLDLRFFRAGGLDHHRHLAQCEAKLDVAFQFPRMKSAPALCGRVSELEASELDCTVCKACMVVEHMVTATVVVPVPAFVIVIGVPDVCESIHRLGLSAVQALEKILVDRPAVAIDSALVEPEGRNQKALMACHDVGEVSEALGAVVAQANVDVNSAHMGGVAFRSGMAEVADDFLQVADVAIV